VKTQQIVMTKMPAARQTAVTTMAHRRQNKKLHHEHFFVCFQPHEMHLMMVFVVVRRHL
jgi:hypothetical protein